MTESGRRRIGVLGGTFDPLHSGHLVVADEVFARLGLDQVLFVPAGDPWQKTTSASEDDRLAMVILGLEGHPNYALSTVDLDRPGPTYTVDTLRDLRSQYPDAELYFIVGTDAYARIDSWKDSEKLTELCEFVVVSRPSDPPVALPEARPGVNWLDIPALPVSSTECRQRVREGLSLEGLVPGEVATYIIDHQLYRSAS
jgi:nicotinate-nucleotide adenylyltransferase